MIFRPKNLAGHLMLMMLGVGSFGPLSNHIPESSTLSLIQMWRLICKEFWFVTRYFSHSARNQSMWIMLGLSKGRKILSRNSW